jgi:aspartyl-tRNA(Asn)/glutamyl-tRNA(Gln) amidotransferase subunit C
MSDVNDSIDINRIASLARLSLTDDERACFQRQLSDVLAYMEKLSELDLEGVEAMSHPHPLQNIFREDVEQDSGDCDVYLRNAPETRDGQFALPKILE